MDLHVAFFLAFEEPVPRVSGGRGTSEAGPHVGPEGPPPPPSRCSWRGWQGARPQRRRNLPWTRIFFFPTPTEIREVFQGRARGGGWRRRSLLSLPLCPLPPSRSRRQPHAASRRGAQSRGCLQGGARRGPHQPDLRVRRRPVRPQVRSAGPPHPPLRRDPGWSSCPPPSTRHPQDLHFARPPAPIPILPPTPATTVSSGPH